MPSSKNNKNYFESFLLWLNNIPVSLAAVLVIIFFAYFRCIQNDLILSDLNYIYNWPLIHDLGNVLRFFINYIPPDGEGFIYSPLKTLWHALFFVAFGGNAAAYHFTGIMIHLICAGLVFGLGLLLTKKAAVAFVAALIFGLHPVQVESIAYASAAVDSIGVLFLLLSFWHFVKSHSYRLLVADPEGSFETVTDREQSYRTHYGLALVFGALAVFSYDLALALPFLFLFYEVWFRRAPLTRTDMLRRHVPLFALAGFYFICQKLSMGAWTETSYLYDSIYLHLLVVSKAFVKYVFMSVLPVHLNLDQVLAPGIFSIYRNDFDDYAVLSQQWFDPRALLGLFLAGGLVWLAVNQYRKRPAVTFSIGWFLIALMPKMNIIFPSVIFFAQRFMYPGIFAVGLLAGVLWLEYAGWARKTKTGTKKEWAAIVVLVFAAGLFFIRTYTRIGQWATPLMFARHEVKHNATSAALRQNLAVNYGLDQPDEAIAQTQEAIALKPNDAHYYFLLADIYFSHDRFEEAKGALLQSVEINPDFSEAYQNLAVIYIYLDDYHQSDMYLDKAKTMYQRQGRIFEAGEAVLQMNFFKDVRADAMEKALEDQLPDIF